MIELYESKFAEHMDIVHRFIEEFRRIEQRTYGKYLGEDEAATLANLQAEVEALDEREKAVQELWKSLAAGLQSAFKGLKRDLDTLNTRIDELNRRLGPYFHLQSVEVAADSPGTRRMDTKDQNGGRGGDHALILRS